MKPAYRTYALIFAVALLFRTLVFAVSPLPPVNQGDAPDYLAIARSMQDQGGYSLDGEKPVRRAPQPARL